MGEDDLTSGKTVCVDAIRIPARTFHETMEMAARMMEASRTSPSVGSGIDSLIAKGGAHSLQFVCR